MPNIPLGISLFSFISLYFIFQRLRFATQSRAVKSIGDEIVKINDFCIEFLETYDYLLKNPDDKNEGNKDSKSLEKKDIIYLNTLAKKIDFHFEYLSNQIDTFPYGTPLNIALSCLIGKICKYQYLSVFDCIFSRLDKKAQYLQETQQLFMNYQDEIRKDTILDRGIVLFENGGLKENLPAPFSKSK